MKLIIAGSREFNNYRLLKFEVINFILSENPDKLEIISGGCRGADKLGERFAIEKQIALEIIPADWNKYGRSAGYIRNEEMAKVATHCICFWDGKSPGTKHMVDLAVKYNLKLKTILV